MKFKVKITEKVIEKRVYGLWAENHKEAAKEAAIIWINQGTEPPDGKSSLQVEERTYEVTGDGPGQYFGTEVEDED